MNGEIIQGIMNKGRKEARKQGSKEEGRRKQGRKEEAKE